MDLILWRHADAEDGDAATPDQKRRLTPRGETQARQVAKWLRRYLPRKPLILVSPAERTQQTAHALELAYQIEPRLGIGAAAPDVLRVAGWPAGSGAVVVIGHQPALGRVAALLLSGAEADWSIRKGGVWWFSSRARGGESRVVLRAALNPDMASI